MKSLYLFFFISYCLPIIGYGQQLTNISLEKTATISSIDSTDECYSFDPLSSLIIPSVIAGGTSGYTFKITNNLDWNIYVNSISKQVTGTNEDYFSPYFTTTPFKIPPHSIVSVGILFAPTDTAKPNTICSATFDINFEGPFKSICSHATYTVSSGILEPKDSFDVNVTGSSDVQIFSTTNKVISKIRVVNSTQEKLKIGGLGLLDNTNFHIMDIAPDKFPIMFNPGNSFLLTLEFETSSAGFYNSALYIYTKSDYSEGFGIPIIGVRASTTSVISEKHSTSSDLNYNYPNPFNSSTTISFTLAERSKTKVEVYDMLGRKIQTLANDIIDAGNHALEFDRAKLPDGIYTIILTTDTEQDIMKVVIGE